MSEGSNNLLLEEEKESKKQYKLSLWWVEHRGALKRLGYGVFMFFDAILLLFVLWTFLDTYAVSYDKERSAIERMVVQGFDDLRSYTISNAAQELQQDDLRVFSLGGDRYDLYAMMSNPNLDWWVEFDYSFSTNEADTPIQRAVFLPGQIKPVINLAITSTTPLRSSELRVSNIVWHRIDHREIGDYETWFAERSDIEVRDPTFRVEQQNEKTIGVTQFTVLNRTAFSFFQPSFFVLLKQGSSVVGVNRITVTSLDSLQSKDVSLNWFGTLPGVSTVEIIPDIQLLDPTTYKRAKGVLDGDVRTRPVIKR